MSSRCEPLRELARLVSLADVASCSLGRFFLEHPDIVAQLLGVSIPVALALSTLDDASLAPSVEAALEAQIDARHQAWRANKEERAERAAALLGARALWEGERAWLDTTLFFRDVLASGAKYIVFTSPKFEVAMVRRRLLEVRAALDVHRDVTFFVDCSGAHFRWRAGKGRLNFLPQRVSRAETSRLVVSLRPSPKLPAVAVASDHAPRLFVG